MKKQTPMQRIKFHKDNLFNIFIESLKVSYENEAHLHHEYEKDSFYYKIASFNKSPPNYWFNLSGVEDDCVMRIEAYLKKSYTTLGLSFKNIKGEDTVKLLVQQELLKNGINSSNTPLVLKPFAEIYSTKPLPFSEMVEKLKEFNKNYLQNFHDLNHQDFITLLINDLNMQELSIESPKKGIKKFISYNNHQPFVFERNPKSQFKYK